MRFAQPGPRPRVWTPPERPAVPLTPPPPRTTRRLFLRRTPLNDHRIHLVAEADRLLPARALEVHPDDLAGLGLAAGAAARIVSGAAEIVLPVRADWRTPPGQLYIPLDPRDAGLRAFAHAAARPAGWPLTCVTVERIEAAGREG